MNRAFRLTERSACVRRIQQVKDNVARTVTDEFLKRHPDWLQRYGERARIMGVQDAGFHVDFLGGAIEAGSPAAFADYARWATRVLRARGIAPGFLSENLLQIRNEIATAIPEFAELVAETVTAGCEACAAAADDTPAPAQGAPDGVHRLFARAAMRGNRHAAAGIALETLRQGMSMVDLYSEVFEASQVEVGRLWESNQISVAEEHMATAVTQYVIARVFGEITPAAPTRGTIVMTGVEGELHQIGSNMVADVLATDGWDVQFLGTNLPQRDVVREVLRSKPSIVAVSTTMLFNVPKVTALVGAVKSSANGTTPKIIVGGAAFRGSAQVVGEIGCDGYARDLQSARLLVNRLFASG